MRGLLSPETERRGSFPLFRTLVCRGFETFYPQSGGVFTVAHHLNSLNSNPSARPSAPAPAPEVLASASAILALAVARRVRTGIYEILINLIKKHANKIQNSPDLRRPGWALHRRSLQRGASEGPRPVERRGGLIRISQQNANKKQTSPDLRRPGWALHGQLLQLGASGGPRRRGRASSRYHLFRGRGRAQWPQGSNPSPPSGPGRIARAAHGGGRG